ncbi:MAG: helix-turn-helix transcriptional regulator [Burkholderiales bacterium]|nr:helix-turn-helix transcriptional regulator [Burkholderiales bacterium]
MRHYSARMAQRDLTTVAERVRESIRRSEKTALALAREMECSPAALHLWASGATRRYDADLMFKFAKLCGVELRWLLYGDGPMLREPVDPQHAARALHALAVMEKQAPYRVEIALDMLDAAAQVRPDAAPTKQTDAS